MTALLFSNRLFVSRLIAAAALVCRAACGLPLAALRRPGRALIIHRRTGEVTAR